MAEPTQSGFVPGQHTIDAYGKGGFRFAQMSHRGSILALPSGVRAWDVAKADQLTVASLALAFEEGEQLDLLLLGTGTEMVPIDPALRSKFQEHGIGLDVMQTGAAARTYNVLLGEHRKVGAALIAVD